MYRSRADYSSCQLLAELSHIGPAKHVRPRFARGIIEIWHELVIIDSLTSSLISIFKHLRHSEAQARNERTSMSAQNTFCCVNAGNCPVSAVSCSRRPTWYTKFAKSFAFCIITSMLAMSVSHLCDKYSTSTSFRIIQADLENLKNNLETLSLEVKNVIEIRDELNSKLQEVSDVIPKISEVIQNLRNEVSEEMNMVPISLENVKNMVKSELETYDADKTGKTDYALESSGGTILSTRDTESYSIGAPVLKLFGIPLCQQHNTPRAVIQTGVLPGDCWAFKGSNGSVVIRLLGYVNISGISLEHISSSISPTGETDTAPRDFSVWGLKDIEDEQPFAFGKFTYNNSGSPLQYFKIEVTNETYDIIELKVHSNSGNADYTCIYRIRVHGTLNRIRSSPLTSLSRIFSHALPLHTRTSHCVKLRPANNGREPFLVSNPNDRSFFSTNAEEIEEISDEFWRYSFFDYT
ncbi:hypothetical protein HN011_010092 [Eciton burchellii]|nr:hypothetical protein HN011_010092 [Eciton burchellii]